MKKIFYFLFLMFYFQLVVFARESCDIKFTNSENQIIILKAEISSDSNSRSAGLMYREELESNNGMIFVYENEQILSFWMKNTYLALSIIYLDKNGIINSMYDMVPLNSSILYDSKEKSMYAIEVNQGWFKENKINIGDRVIVDGCISK